MNDITIVKYNYQLKKEWDDFITNSKNSHFFFHRDYMEYHSERFIDFSLLCYSKNKLIALFPANIANNNIYSHGGLTFGGFITNERMTTPLMLNLFQNTLKFYSNKSIEKLIYKPIPYIYHKIPAQEDLYALFINNAKLIRRDVSSVINLQKKIRYTKGRKWSINKAKKNKIEVIQSYDYNSFYSFLEKNTMEKYNVKPTHSLQEIKLLTSRFPDNIKLYAAFLENEMIAGTIVYENNECVHTQYMSSTENGRELGALDLTIDHLIKNIYYEKKYFSFGISTENNGRYLNNGLISQKEGFGAHAVVHDFYELKL